MDVPTASPQHIDDDDDDGVPRRPGSIITTVGAWEMM
jgi:hypothetical protein